MKKLLFALVALLTSVACMYGASSVYVNPLTHTANLNSTIAKRLFKKGVLGLSKAKTISVATGQQGIAPGTPEAEPYDYILTMYIEDVTVEEAGTVGNLLGVLSNSSTRTPDYEGKISVIVSILDAKTGEQFFLQRLIPSSTDKNKEKAVFDATDDFDYDMTDLTDDAFRITGKVLDATEVDKKGTVKKVRLALGSSHGARKGQAYELYKREGDTRTLIGAAKCEAVLSPTECILSVNGKKGAGKVMSQLIQENDGSYAIEAESRAKSNFLRDNFQDVDKIFAKEERPEYLDPFGRTKKPVVAFLAVDINDNNFAAQKDNLANAVLRGLAEVTTIEVRPKIYPDFATALSDGVDGLLDISVDRVTNSSERTQDGKTMYTTEVYYTVAGIDPRNNRYLDMKSFEAAGTSFENTNEANANALGLLDDDIKLYCQDLFPVAASIIDATEVKKNSVKKVRIDQGTALGLKKGMTFDIYEERAEGGADSRVLLGEGSVEKDGLTANEAILKVKGKNDGDEKLYQLLTNADENTRIVLVSKAFYNVLNKSLNFMRKL